MGTHFNPYGASIIAETSAVEGRKDIVAVSIRFNDATVALSYKVHINNYLTTVRKADLENSQQPNQNNAAQQPTGA